MPEMPAARRQLHYGVAAAWQRMRPAPVLLAAFLVLAAVALPLAEAHGTQQRAAFGSAGASYGVQGVATNRANGPGFFQTTHSHYGVRVTVSGAATLDPFVAICIDLDKNDFCDDAEGDLLFEGYSRVEGWSATPFDNVLVFSDMVNWDPDTRTAHVTGQGTVKVEWLDGQREPTPPPSRTPDAIESALGFLLGVIFGLL